MTASMKIGSFFLLSSLLLASHQAQGQAPQTNIDRLTPAMRYFGHGLRASAARPQTARPQARRLAPPVRQYQSSAGKPFQNVHRRPSISPYLGLDTIESSVGLPNYYSRVRPQIQQQEADDAHAAKLRRLQHQTRTASAQSAIAGPSNNSIHATGYQSQFLNHSSFYPTLRR